MSLLDKKTSADAVRLLVFMLVTCLATGLLIILVGNITFGSSRDYSAVFTDATGVNKGDDVRIAGVKVGTVKDITIDDEDRALISFTVADEAKVTKASEATIRYRNLVGQRYLAITEGVGDTSRLEEGSTIPVDRTHPALDLTVLFNGFKPLFRALSPSDVNTLSNHIVNAFQGEGGTLEGLLGYTASVTSTLADRDQLIGELIDNLNTVLVSVGERDDQLERLITSLRGLVKGFKDDREQILGSLDKISTLAVQTADLVSGIRQPFVKDISELRRFAGNLDKNKAELDRAMQVLPIKLNKVGRTAIYGSWFNFYLCEFKGRVTLPTGQTLPDINYQTGSDRCSLP